MVRLTPAREFCNNFSIPLLSNSSPAILLWFKLHEPCGNNAHTWSRRTRTRGLERGVIHVGGQLATGAKRGYEGRRCKGQIIGEWRKGGILYPDRRGRRRVHHAGPKGGTEEPFSDGIVTGFLNCRGCVEAAGYARGSRASAESKGGYSND
jgi:hypothetical protein